MSLTHDRDTTFCAQNQGLSQERLRSEQKIIYGVLGEGRERVTTNQLRAAEPDEQAGFLNEAEAEDWARRATSPYFYWKDVGGSNPEPAASKTACRDRGMPFANKSK